MDTRGHIVGSGRCMPQATAFVSEVPAAGRWTMVAEAMGEVRENLHGFIGTTSPDLNYDARSGALRRSAACGSVRA